METNKESKESKNAKWELRGKVAVGILPKATIRHDLSRFLDCVQGEGQDATTARAMIFYGFKQWESSNYAGKKSDIEKATNANDDFKLACEKGLKLVMTERGHVIKPADYDPSVKSSSEASEAKALVSSLKEHSQVCSIEGLTLKKLLRTSEFTPEDQAKLDELMLLKFKLEGKVS